MCKPKSREDLRQIPRGWLESTGLSFVVEDLPVAHEILKWDLGLGESAVLNWAFQNRDFEAIVDDRAARKCAAVLNIPVRGTIGVILAARNRGLLGAARPICEQLIQSGLMIDKEVLETALAQVGE